MNRLFYFPNLLFLLLLFAGTVCAGTVTLTTYYPSPSANYDDTVANQVVIGENAAPGTAKLYFTNGNLGIGIDPATAPLTIKSVSFPPSGDYTGISLIPIPPGGIGPAANSEQTALEFRSLNGGPGFAVGRDFTQTGTNDFFILDQVSGAAKMIINSAGHVTIVPAGGIVSVGKSLPQATFDVCGRAADRGSFAITSIPGAPPGDRFVAVNGNVGISQSAPQAALDVNGTVNASTLDLSGVAGITTGTGNITSAGDVSAASLSSTATMSASNLLHADGNLSVSNNATITGTATGLAEVTMGPLPASVGTVFLTVTGDLIVGNDIYAYAYLYPSDQKLKHNIIPITGALDQVLQLKPVHFQWKKNGQKDIGFIAQHVATVVPEAVTSDTQGMLSINYAKLSGLLIAALQEQEHHIAGLKERVERLKGQP